MLGLRFVKKTVNFDSPDAYHLYFGDEQGSPGSILTWFEFPGAAPGRPGIGDIHTLQLGVASRRGARLLGRAARGQGLRVGGASGRCASPTTTGSRFELVVDDSGDAPLRAEHPEIPAEHAITGLVGARAYSAFEGVEEKVLTDTLGFEYLGGGEYRLNGAARHFAWAHDAPPAHHGRQGAGSVHHIAWASPDDDHLAWQARVADAGGFVTEVRDRDYFRSIYFREPRGVLFEIATLSPGFAVDEDPERLGEALRLPKQHEHLRERLEQVLEPVVNPRAARREAVSA